MPPDGTVTVLVFVVVKLPINTPFNQVNAPVTVVKPVPPSVPPLKLNVVSVVELGKRSSVPALNVSTPVAITEPAEVIVCVPPLNCSVLPEAMLNEPESVELPP